MFEFLKKKAPEAPQRMVQIPEAELRAMLEQQKFVFWADMEKRFPSVVIPFHNHLPLFLDVKKILQDNPHVHGVPTFFGFEDLAHAKQAEAEGFFEGKQVEYRTLLMEDVKGMVTILESITNAPVGVSIFRKHQPKPGPFPSGTMFGF